MDTPTAMPSIEAVDKLCAALVALYFGSLVDVMVTALCSDSMLSACEKTCPLQ